MKTKKEESSLVTIDENQKFVATMLLGTTESSFTLMRGVPSNDGRRVSEYLWAEVIKDGKPVKLVLSESNPLVFDIPGTYKFRNDGMEDEAALIDVQTFRK